MAVGLASCGQAQFFELNSLNLPVPDGDSAGLLSSIEVSGVAASPFRIEVQLALGGVGEGGYAGDPYVSLQHAGGYSVLLNRPGSREGRPGGYGDGVGMALTFSDSGPEEVHNDRLTLSGSHSVPIEGMLTGTGQPDGRNVDPGGNGWQAPRTALLDAFSGTDPNGRWSLFVADLLSVPSKGLGGVPDPVVTTL